MMTWAGSWGHSAISASRGLIRVLFRELWKPKEMVENNQNNLGNE